MSDDRPCNCEQALGLIAENGDLRTQLGIAEVRCREWEDSNQLLRGEVARLKADLAKLREQTEPAAVQRSRGCILQAGHIGGCDIRQAVDPVRGAESRCTKSDAHPTAEAEEMPEKCPTCDSPSPRLHPAMQYEGEVQVCRDAWHSELPAYAKVPRATPAIVAARGSDVEVLRDAAKALSWFVTDSRCPSVDYTTPAFKWAKPCGCCRHCTGRKALAPLRHMVEGKDGGGDG